jgi:hypothetical protein
MLIAAVSMIAPTWKQAKHSTDEWINKTRRTDSVEYNLAIKGRRY